jgi:hypothetical protein
MSCTADSGEFSFRSYTAAGRVRANLDGSSLSNLDSRVESLQVTPRVDNCLVRLCDLRLAPTWDETDVPVLQRPLDAGSSRSPKSCRVDAVVLCGGEEG